MASSSSSSTGAAAAAPAVDSSTTVLTSSQNNPRVPPIVVELSAADKSAIDELLQGLETKLPFTKNAMNVIARRYLMRDTQGRLLETPEGMFTRIARALAAVESSYSKTPEQIAQFEADFYRVMADFEFMPAGRTLANCGAQTRLVSNCIVLHIEDSMESIFGTLRDAALLQKAGSGLGFPLHLMRPAGAATTSSFGSSSGPCSFLHVYNAAFAVIKQQGRHGANMAVMRVSHPDILEFVHCKDVEGDLKNFNVSVGLTHEFMRQVEANETKPWMCEFNGVPMLPRRVKRDRNFNLESVTPVEMTARELFMEIVSSAWKTGEPGCVFLDTVNDTNPLPGLGRLEASNPCGEQFLHDGDVCNLGSINLERFVTTDRKIDFERLREVTHVAVRMLDNVVDLSDFPVERVSSTFRGNRRLGIGVMGFADMLFRLNVGYNTEEGRDVAEKVMKCIQESGSEMSQLLAAEKGVFPNFEKSVYAQRGERRRNAAITNVPPTGTIAMMLDVSGGVEPAFALAYFYKNILGGEVSLSYVNKHLKRELEARGLFSEELMRQIVEAGSLQHVDLPQDVKNVFVTAMDISARDHILAQAAFQRHCDNAISKTINFPNSATREDIIDGYILAWQTGCKGCTVYRDGSRVLQVLNLNKDAKKDGQDEEIEGADEALEGVEEGSESEPAVAEMTQDEDDGEVIVVREAHGLRLIEDMGVRSPTRPVNPRKRKAVSTPTSSQQSSASTSATAAAGSLDENALPAAKSHRVYAGAVAEPSVAEKTVDRVMNKRTMTTCPDCSNTLQRAEGCVSCICGFSVCS